MMRRGRWSVGLLVALLMAPALHAQEGAAPHPAPPSPPPITPPSTPTKPASPGGAPGPAKAGTPTDAPADGAPSEEQVAIAVADLTAAADEADAGARALAVARNAGLASPKVVKALARFLKDKDGSVRLAAVDALGRTPHADALKELHHLLQSSPKLRTEPAAFAELLKAIGRHGDASSLKPLSEDAWKSTDTPIVVARLYAIANIRTKAALAQLMDLMNVDPTLPWDTSPYMPTFRVALARLAGVDQGLDKDAWRTWWRDAEKSLKLPKDPPPMPDALQREWDSFWKVPAASALPPAH